jgi:hypothetical protein
VVQLDVASPLASRPRGGWLQKSLQTPSPLNRDPPGAIFRGFSVTFSRRSSRVRVDEAEKHPGAGLQVLARTISFRTSGQ